MKQVPRMVRTVCTKLDQLKRVNNAVIDHSYSKEMRELHEMRMKYINQRLTEINRGEEGEGEDKKCLIWTDSAGDIDITQPIKLL